MIAYIGDGTRTRTIRFSQPEPVTQASITAALADGLEMLLLDWRQALADRDDDLLDWLAPRIVARAHLTISHARQAAK